MNKKMIANLLDEDEIERCRRVRSEISSEFKTIDDVLAYMKKLEKNGIRHNAQLREQDRRAKQSQKNGPVTTHSSEPTNGARMTKAQLAALLDGDEIER